MLNQSVIVGRVCNTPEVTIDNDNKVTTLVLAVPRSYKNEEGEYETDFITCILWKGVAENVCEYVKKGDLVGVKGRLQSKEIKIDNTTRYTTLQLVAERVTFLSTKKPNEENEEE